MKGSDSPCLICKDREIGCHSQCMRYLDYQIRIQAEHEREKADPSPWQAKIFDISPVYQNNKKKRRRKHK